MVQIAFVQFDIAWENPEQNVTHINRLLDSYTGPNFDVLILPETWSTGFTMSKNAHQAEDTAKAFMQKLATTYQCQVIGGVAAKIPENQENRCYLFGPNEQPEYYVKNRTFNFNGEHLFFQAGSQPQTWQVGDFRLSPLICYDLRFPELARRVAKQSDGLLYIANWPSVREHHWRSLAIARAIENQCFVVTVNRIGKDGKGLEHPGSSLVIDPLGNILLDAQSQSGVFSINLDAQITSQVRQKWPFLSDM